MDELRGIWRGKRIDEKIWVDGYLICPEVNGKFAYIGYLFATDDHGVNIAPVDPSTLGECTGLRDKNGKPIFEGDICKDENSTYLIVWHMHQWQCKVIHSDCVLALDCSFPLCQWDNCKENGYRTLEIIGNIHDNPEMLE